MSRVFQGVRLVTIAVGLAVTVGCGPSAESTTPNPELGPPPKLEPGRGASGEGGSPMSKVPK